MSYPASDIATMEERKQKEDTNTKTQEKEKEKENCIYLKNCYKYIRETKTLNILGDLHNNTSKENR